jgi:hypothetical protein
MIKLVVFLCLSYLYLIHLVGILVPPLILPLHHRIHTCNLHRLLNLRVFNNLFHRHQLSNLCRMRNSHNHLLDHLLLSCLHRFRLHHLLITIQDNHYHHLQLIFRISHMKSYFKLQKHI